MFKRNKLEKLLLENIDKLNKSLQRNNFLDLVELDDEEYVVLLPVAEEGEEEDGEVVILKELE